MGEGDPRPRKDGKCVMCLQKLPDKPAKAGDPFCSTECCHDYHGVEFPSVKVTTT